MRYGSRVNQVVKVVNGLGIFSSCFDAPLVPALELWTLLNYTDTTNRKISHKKKEERKRTYRRSIHLDLGLSNDEAT